MRNAKLAQNGVKGKEKKVQPREGWVAIARQDSTFGLESGHARQTGRAL
jgi:hypothetical protein